MGHTNRELAEAAALLSGLTSDTCEVISCVSAVDAGLLDVWEFKETELSEGDRRLTFRLCCGGREAAAGERLLPLPRTRPPPRDLREVMMESLAEMEGSSCGGGRLGETWSG
jgi:hypothetical protein